MNVKKQLHSSKNEQKWQTNTIQHEFKFEKIMKQKLKSHNCNITLEKFGSSSFQYSRR